MQKNIYVEPANTGNLMFRLMFAEHLRSHFDDAIITGAHMPEWGIVPQAGRPLRCLKVVNGNRLDVPAILKVINRPDCDGVLLECFAQRLEYFESRRSHMLKWFASSERGQPIADDELAIHVRAGDVLGGIHPDYNLVPISYYRGIVERTGLRPVFTGQTQPSYYVEALRHHFPGARFLTGRNWLDDFQTTRNARHIVVSVSTFVWLAAWLSETAERIYMPQLGIFNPEQRPDIDLLPVNDPRYVFERHPVEAFTASRQQLERILA